MSVFNEENNDPLNTLVGEGKKFKTVEDLAKGKIEADEYIKQLHKEAEEYRAELSARISVEEALNKVKEQPVVEVTSQTTHEERQDKELPDIDSIVSEKIKTITAQQKANENELKSDQMMREKYGDKAKETMETRSKELGLSLEYIRKTAQESPQAFAQLMGLNSQHQSGPNPINGGDVNISSLNTGVSSVESRLKDIAVLRKTNRRKYFSPKIQKEIMELKF